MRHLIGALAALASLPAVALAQATPARPAPAAPAPPPGMIRDLAPATVQLLGTILFSQDRQSWLATDMLMDAKVDTAAVIGWINVPYGDGSRVRFLKEGSPNPFAAYDVIFDGKTKPTVAVARDPTLAPAELTQWRALQAALALKLNHCSARPANHVEVQLPATGEWLVWIMAPWDSPKAFPVGGHTRVTVSPDGRRVLLREALSRGCQLIDPTPPAGDANAALPLSQPVSNVPVETQVFTALQARRPVLVTTADGATWRVDGKTVSKLVQPAVAARAAPPKPAATTAAVRPRVASPAAAKPAANRPPAASAPPRSGSAAARPSGSSPTTASPPVRLRGSVSSR